ncbi:lysozyme [Mannheimia indoligenes]|uniref:lysozyme n=1 Tax=Mannheimia indoligenes TaxID=3103145 RepID=UPI002FE50A75
MSKSVKIGVFVCSVAAIIGTLKQYYGSEIRTSETGLAIIGNTEGCRRDPYKCSSDVLTVGIGSTEASGEKIDVNHKYTDKQIADRWLKDLKIAERCINRYFNGDKMNENQFSAMVSAAFNLGCYNLRFYPNENGKYIQTTIHKYAMAKDFKAMCNRIPDFNRSGGKVLRGLEIRRAKEKALCLGQEVK